MEKILDIVDILLDELAILKSTIESKLLILKSLIVFQLRKFSGKLNIVEDYCFEIDGFLEIKIDDISSIYVMYDKRRKGGFKNSVLGCAESYEDENGNPQYIVGIDKYICGAPKEVFNFIVSHEIGHIHNNHLKEYDPNETEEEYEKRMTLKNEERKMNIRNGEVNKEELEADEYAANDIGIHKSIHALVYLAKMVGIYTTDGYEFILRAQHLRLLAKNKDE